MAHCAISLQFFGQKMNTHIIYNKIQVLSNSSMMKTAIASYYVNSLFHMVRLNVAAHRNAQGCQEIIITLHTIQNPQGIHASSKLSVLGECNSC